MPLVLASSLSSLTFIDATSLALALTGAAGLGDGLAVALTGALFADFTEERFFLRHCQTNPLRSHFVFLGF